MKTKTLPPSSLEMNRSSKNTHSFRILNDLEVSIEITDNPFDLDTETLFQMAARINKKRSFLFVSKILGKHIPVNPHISLLGGACLGLLYHDHLGISNEFSLTDIVNAFQNVDQAKALYEKMKANPLRLEEPTLFIGFAETATALGHSMFDIFKGPTQYLHTTRDIVREFEPVISFEEEHSHATSHRCYALEDDFFDGNEPIVLVDDEVTTGKTALNIIRDLHRKSFRQHYVLASLLDWRSDKDLAQFAELEDELGITITCLSLLKGKMSVTGSPGDIGDTGFTSSAMNQSIIFHHCVEDYFDFIQASSQDTSDQVNPTRYVSSTGRFGLDGAHIAAMDKQIAACGEYLQGLRKGARTLAMGSGEFMYIPMRIAADMGEGVCYQSSTRSPIYPSQTQGYAVQNSFPFISHEDPSIANFFYNIPSGRYDEVFVFIERANEAESLESYVKALQRTSIPFIHLVHFTKEAYRKCQSLQ